MFPTMMPSALCHFRFGQPPVLNVLAALVTLWAAPLARAADLLWDADNVTPNAQHGSGAWTNSTGNWRNLTTSTDNQNWVNADFDSGIFGAGTDGSYAITLAGTVRAGGGITFSPSGYTLSGTVLILKNLTIVNSPITVVAFTSFRILTATNLANPLATWVPIQTNLFDVFGRFQTDIPVSPETHNRFFRLAVP